MSKHLSFTSKLCFVLALFLVTAAVARAASNFINFDLNKPAFVLDNNVQINGNVGIGTASPGAKLEVAGGDIRVGNGYGIGAGGNAQGIYDGTSGSAYLRFDVGGSERLRIINNGNVGIGTTNPGSKLTISNGDLSVSNAIYTRDLAVGGAAWPGVNNAAIGGNLRINGPSASGTGAYAFSLGGNGNFGVDAPGVVGGRFAITEGGKVGIGTASPGNRLAIVMGVNDTIPALGSNGGSFGFFKNEGAAAGNYGFLTGLLINGDVFEQVQRIDGTATAYNLLLQPSGGNVGIGTATPNGPLQIKAGSNLDLLVNTVTSGWTTLSAVNDNNSASTPLEIRSSVTDFSLGKVGIGTATPGSALTVNGDIQAIGAISGESISSGGNVSALGQLLGNSLYISSNTNIYAGDFKAYLIPGTPTISGITIGNMIYADDNIYVPDNAGLSIYFAYGLTDSKNTGYFRRLALQADGNMVIYDNNGVAKWSSNTTCANAPSGVCHY